MSSKRHNQTSRRHTILAKLAPVLLLPLLLFSLVFVSLAGDTTTLNPFSYQANLSETGHLAGLQSGPPKMIVRGGTIAVVWSDQAEKAANLAYSKDFGHIYLKSAQEGAGYWRPKVKVFTADEGHWGAQPDAVFDRDEANTVHIVWAEKVDCNELGGENCSPKTIKYNRCDVSDNINTCASAQIIATGDNVARFNPKIAIDDDQDLHVIWSESGHTVAYSRSNDRINWSNPSPVTVINNDGGAQEIDFMATTASGGRLHLVWHNEMAQTIRYIYDADDEDNSLTPTIAPKSFRSALFPFISGSAPGNPTLAGLENWVFIAFDVQHPTNSSEFGLFYSMSTDNGASWLDTPYNIPGQRDLTAVEVLSGNTATALQPSLAITSTGTLTSLHVAWQEAVTVDFFQTQRIKFSTLTLSQRVDFDPNASWTERFTATESPLFEERHTHPSLVVTDSPPAGHGKAHVTYLTNIALKNEPTTEQLDVHYRGSIGGTIDPAYILANFRSGGGGYDYPLQIKIVTPSVIQSDMFSPREKLQYTISFTNQGHLDAIGLGITDTLPAKGVSFNDDLVVTGSGVTKVSTYNPAPKEVIWFGDVPAGAGVHIAFSVTTNDQLDLPAIDYKVRNLVTMWTLGTRGAPILPQHLEACGSSYTHCADTLITLMPIIHLPLIAK